MAKEGESCLLSGKSLDLKLELLDKMVSGGEGEEATGEATTNK